MLGPFLFSMFIEDLFLMLGFLRVSLMIILHTHCKTNTSEVVKSLDKILKPLME